MSKQPKTAHSVHSSASSLNPRLACQLQECRTKYGYDTLGQVTSGRKYWSEGTPVAGMQFTYSFDDIGNRKTTGTGGDQTGGPLRTANYSANNLNQYASRDVPGFVNVIGSAKTNATVSLWTPDGWWAQTIRHSDYYRGELAVNNSTGALWLTITNQAVLGNGGSVDIATNTMGNLFLPKNQEGFGYDLDGNMTSDGRWTYTWDAENRLIRMVANTATGPQQRLDFEYDSKSRRIQKKVWNNTAGTGTAATDLTFVYDTWNLLGEVNTSHSAVRTYVWGLDLNGGLKGAGGVGALIQAIDSMSGANFVVTDGNGNLAALLGSNDGSTSAVYEYSPFGQILRLQGANAKINPFRFSTKYEDETDLLHFGYRFYQPSNGKWLSRDPIGELGAANTYVFLANDSLNDFDFLGLLNVVRLGFMGAGKTTGNWLMGLNSPQIFTSRDQSGAMNYILKQLDTNKDGTVNDCDDEADIRVTGYSWGGWTAVKLAEEINTTKQIKSSGIKHRWVRLGLLDPVDTARGGSGRLTRNVYFALNFYQQNGCYGGRCPGPSSWYKGRAITGAANIDVTNDRPSAPLGDGVPLSMTPDHVDMMIDYHSYATKIGLTLWLLPWP